MDIQILRNCRVAGVDYTSGIYSSALGNQLSNASTLVLLGLALDLTAKYPAVVPTLATDSVGKTTGINAGTQKRLFNLDRIKAAFERARASNYVNNIPLTQPTQWVSGTTYFAGEIVQNNGNMYQLHPSMSGSGVVSLANVPPTHTNDTPVYDGTGSTGCLWIYLGKVTGASSTIPHVGAPVATTSADMQGYISAYYAVATNWSATCAAISASTAAVISAVTGTIRIGDPIPQLGTNIYIIAQASGTTGGAGTYTLNTAVTYGGGTISWNNAPATLGLTWQIQLTKNYLPVLVTGMPTLDGSWFTFTNCTVSGGILTVGGVSVGAWKNPCGNMWTGSQSIAIEKQLTGTPGGVGTYYLASGAVDQLTPFTLTNAAYPQVDYWSINQSTLAHPSTVSEAPYLKTEFYTNARWVAFEFNQAYGTSNGINYSPVVAINNTLISHNRIIKRENPAALSFYVIDVSKANTQGGMNLISIWTAGAGSHGVSRIYTGSNDTIIPKASNGLKISTEGDSLCFGGNGSPVSLAREAASELAALLGFDEHLQNAVGGTRMTDISTTLTTFKQRIDRIIAFNPTVHVVYGNHNDVSVATSAQRQAAVIDYIQTFRAALPGAYLFITGPKVLRADQITGNGELNLTKCDQDIQAGIASANDAMTYYIPTLTWAYGDTTNGTGPWSGPNAATTGKYFYGISPYTDSHPLPAEYQMFNQYVANSIKAVLFTL